MKIIEPFVELINAPEYKTLLTTIEAAGRTCYKSEDKITDGSAEKFVRGIIKRGHEAVIEHGSLTVRFICDRGVSHEIVRHRLAAFCQESTRYCNYGKEGFGGEITVIRPSTFAKKRLRKFYDAFSAEHDRLIQYYQMPDDYTWLCKEMLKRIGVDVEAWNRERREPNEAEKH